MEPRPRAASLIDARGLALDQALQLLQQAGALLPDEPVDSTVWLQALIDALCDYTFNGNIAGKEVALGNGNAAQITMPAGMKNLIQTDAPVVAYPESKYTFECSAIANPRKIYCGAVTSATDVVPASNSLVAYPNPFTTQVQISNLPETATCTLFNKLGQTIYSGNSISTQDFSYLPTDIYLLSIGNKTFMLFKE